MLVCFARAHKEFKFQTYAVRKKERGGGKSTGSRQPKYVKKHNLRIFICQSVALYVCMHDSTFNLNIRLRRCFKISCE